MTVIFLTSLKLKLKFKIQHLMDVLYFPHIKYDKMLHMFHCIISSNIKFEWSKVSSP
jgi:hypothetical protein